MFKNPRTILLDLLAVSLQAVEPKKSIRAAVQLCPESLMLKFGQQTLDVSSFEHIFIVGCGKASSTMGLAIEEIFGNLITDGAISVKYDHSGPTAPKFITIFEAGHPQPDVNGLRAATKAVELLMRASERDLVIALLSGGGSSLWPYPVSGISLQDLARFSGVLLASGANIQEMNILRKHLSLLHGGWAARYAYPAKTLVFTISDVIGDDIATIASGPFCADPSTYHDCLKILKSYGIENKTPLSILNHIVNGIDGIVPETPKLSECCFDNVSNIIIASNAKAVQAIVEKGKSLGFNVVTISTPIQGEAFECGKEFASQLIKLRSTEKLPTLLVSGGETTVTLSEKPGVGGRNQEFALSAALKLNGVSNTFIMSCGTDGTDGPTDANGAIVDKETINRAGSAGFDPLTTLKNNNSYALLKATGDLIFTGPTLTNVMDIQVGLFL